MKLKSVLVIAKLSAVATVYASDEHIIGESSSYNGDKYVLVGTSTIPFGPHKFGYAGIGVSNYYYVAKFAKVDFNGLASKVKPTMVSGINVYNLGGTIVDKDLKGDKKEKHQDFGTFVFTKVGDGDVWYGEWAPDNNNAVKTGNWAHRQVYYVGDDTGTTIPTSGSATYTVHGFNRFNGSNVMKDEFVANSGTKSNVMHGEFTANFGTQKLTGSIQNDNLMIDMFSVGFNNAGEISGIAFARNPKTQKFLARTVSNSDKVKGLTGHFFGANAASLAGFAQFDDQHRDYDTAFGGTKK